MNAEVKNEKLNKWIKEITDMCQPDNIYICNGTKEEYDRMMAKLIESGSATVLKKRANSFLFRSDPSDVARVEDRTYISTSSKDEADYKEMVYEGYGPNGIAIVVETATDNPTRTVANIRSYFNRYGGSLGTTGSLQFLFDHKCVFKITPKDGVSLEDLELELIDYGVDELVEDEDNTIILYGEFQSYSSIQKYLEENNFEIHSAEFERIPNDMKELNEEQKAQVQKLLDKIEDDEDVQNVSHNMIE